MTLEAYLRIHEGSRWTWEDTQYVLSQIAALDKRMEQQREAEGVRMEVSA